MLSIPSPLSSPTQFKPKKNQKGTGAETLILGATKKVCGTVLKPYMSGYKTFLYICEKYMYMASTTKI